MGLAEFQSALALLYTDATTREQCARDRDTFASRFRLSESEAASLAESVLEKARDFASTLACKRFSEAARSMPLAAEILGARFAPWFAAYAAATPLPPGHSPARDALAFHEWLRTARRAEIPSAEWDALRYEQGWLIMQHTRRPLLIRWLLAPGSTNGSRSLVVWWRVHGRLRYWAA
jgi:hypothetical protein